jgi:hypothetical protein
MLNTLDLSNRGISHFMPGAFDCYTFENMTHRPTAYSTRFTQVRAWLWRGCGWGARSYSQPAQPACKRCPLALFVALLTVTLSDSFLLSAAGNPLGRQHTDTGENVKSHLPLIWFGPCLSVQNAHDRVWSPLVQVPDGSYFLSCAYVSMQRNSIDGSIESDAFSQYGALEP